MTDEREYFTQKEAEALVGKHIRTLIAWSGVPTDTIGKVIHAEQNPYGWTVAIQWDLPTKPRQIDVGQSLDESFLVVSGGKPLIDWFSSNEYQQYLVGIDEGAKRTAGYREPKNYT